MQTCLLKKMIHLTYTVNYQNMSTCNAFFLRSRQAKVHFKKVAELLFVSSVALKSNML